MQYGMRSDRQKLKDTTYLNICKEHAVISKDENTNVGALIVSSSGRQLSTGYNGAAQHMDDDVIPHGREIVDLTLYVDGEACNISTNKHPFMIHAERNAIEECPRPDELYGATIYVTHKPCNDCAYLISRKGIKRVVIAEPDPNCTSSSIGSNWELSLYYFAAARMEVWLGDNQIELSLSEPIINTGAPGVSIKLEHVSGMRSCGCPEY
jgi:dCMP deaminase